MASFFRVIDQFWSKSKESGDKALFLLLNDRDHIAVMSPYNELGLPSAGNFKFNFIIPSFGA